MTVNLKTWERKSRRGRRVSFWEKYLGGHFSLGPVTVYGFNAMHVAINVRTRRWGYVCFHPTIRMNGHWWRWYFYCSPDATPHSATFAIGPGVEGRTKYEKDMGTKKPKGV